MVPSSLAPPSANSASSASGKTSAGCETLPSETSYNAAEAPVPQSRLRRHAAVAGTDELFQKKTATPVACGPAFAEAEWRLFLGKRRQALNLDLGQGLRFRV